MKLSVIILVILLFLIPELSFSQEPYVLHEGDIIRVEYQCKDWYPVAKQQSIKASVLGLNGNLFHVIDLKSSEQRTIPLDCVQHWWHGNESKARNEFFVFSSVMVGGSLGYLAGVTFFESEDKNRGINIDISPPIYLGTTLLGMLVGGMIGSVLTKQTLKYKWQRINNKQIIVEPKVSEGAVGVGLTLNF